VADTGDSDYAPPGADVEVAQYARAARRGRPPAKAFVSKPFSARSLMAEKAKSPPGALLERLHGKGPLVKWPAEKPSRAASYRPPAMPAPQPTIAMQAAPASTGENMSERFIAERLLSDRGTSNFNPQIPRRIPDIPSPTSVKASEADTDGRRLLVGKQVVLSGEIGGCERLVVEGKVDVTLKDVKTLEVGAQGVFKGTAEVEAAMIAGTFEGTLRVSGHLDVGPGAVVKGTVSYGTIAVASGGKLLGTIESVEAPAS